MLYAQSSGTVISGQSKEGSCLAMGASLVTRISRRAVMHSTLKPVLNWANVCSPEHTSDTSTNYDSFLNWTLVRRIWFWQSKLYFILNWLVMRCKLRPELAADAQQTAWSKMWAKVKSSQYTLIIPHRVLQLTTISFWVSETRLHLPQVNK